MVFSILPVTEGGSRRKQTDQVNAWLCGWCQAQGFSFYDHRQTFRKLGRLTADRAHLTKWSKNDPGNKLAELISRALN